MKELLQKFVKSEFWVGVLAMIAAALAPKFGIPEESINSFLLAISGIAVTYIGGRSHAKAAEAKAVNAVNPT